jgi:hypothetical protein
VLWWAHGRSRGAVVYTGGDVYNSYQCPLIDDTPSGRGLMSSCSCGDPADSYNLSYAMLRDAASPSVARGSLVVLLLPVVAVAGQGHERLDGLRLQTARWSPTARPSARRWPK